MILVLAVALVIILCLAVVVFFYYQLKANRRLKSQAASLKDESKWGECRRCRQRRIIVNKGEGLCAVCWSTLYSKQGG